MASQPGWQITAIHILTNIPQRISNQAIKFGQLMKYKMRHIFLEKLHTKYENMVETLFPNPFLKKSKLSISLYQ